MANNLYLGRGDGPGADGAINLNDSVTYAVVRGPLGFDDLSQGRISLVMNVYGDSPSAVVDAYRALVALIEQASERAGQPVGPTPQSARVALSVRWGTTAWTYIDVTGGRISQPSDPVHIGILYQMLDVVLDLTTLPYGRGAMIQDAPSDQITANGTSYLYRAGIPGDLPALVRATLVDQSGSSKHINALTIGSMSQPYLASGVTDFDPYSSLTHSGGSTEASSDTSNATNHARKGVTAGADWSTVATLTGPSARYTRGEYHVLLRNRVASATLPTTPSSLAATAASWFSVRQGIGNSFGAQGTDTSATSVECTFNQATLQGSTLVAVVAKNNDESFTLTPDGGDWQLATYGSRPEGRVWVYYWENADPASGVTFTGGGSGGIHTWHLFEFRHVSLASVFDVAQANDAASGTSLNSGTTLFTSQPFEYAIAAFAMFRSGGTSAGSWASGWTERSDQPVNSTSAQDISMAVATASLTTQGAKVATATAANSGSWAGVIATFRLEGGLPAGDYDIKIVGVNLDGSKSAASSTLSKSGVTAGQYLPLTWTGDATSHYEIYWRVDGGDWYRIITETPDTSYDLYRQTGILAEPPAQASYVPNRLRLRVGLAGGDIVHALPDVAGYPSAIGWGLTPMGTISLPPMPTLEGDLPQNWYLEVQSRGATTGNTDVDVPILIPANRPVYRTWYRSSAGVPLANTALLAWTMETRRDGYSTTLLHETVTVTDESPGYSVPSSILDETQGWLAMRVSLNDLDNDSGLVAWMDDGNNGLALYWDAVDGILGGRFASGNFTKDWGSSAFTPTLNTPFTVVLAWTSTGVQVSVNGGAFSALGDGTTSIPTLSAVKVYLGTDADGFGSGEIDLNGSLFWVASGTGTLTDTDAATLHALGTQVPRPNDLPTAAALTMSWDTENELAALGPLAGVAESRGSLLAGPGDTLFVIVPEIGTSYVLTNGEPRGISDMENVAYTIQLSITPRYRRLAGSGS